MSKTSDSAVASGGEDRALLADKATVRGGTNSPEGFELELNTGRRVLFVPSPDHTGIALSQLPSRAQSLERLEKALGAFSNTTNHSSTNQQISIATKQVADQVRQHGRAAGANGLKVMAHPGGYTFELPDGRLVSIVTPNAAWAPRGGIS